MNPDDHYRYTNHVNFRHSWEFSVLSLPVRTRLELRSVPGQATFMLDQLSCTCEAPNCNRRLGVGQFMLAMETAEGVRCAYECECGTVTVTVRG